MKNNEKHPLQSLLDNADVETRSYSGRAMYGRECLGVDVSDFADFLTTYTEALRHQAPSSNNDEWWDAIDEGLRSARTDSMGMGIIVYFPGVKYTDEDDDSDEPGQAEADEP